MYITARGLTKYVFCVCSILNKILTDDYDTSRGLGKMEEDHNIRDWVTRSSTTLQAEKKYGILASNYDCTRCMSCRHACYF
jgi:hypothetical protein